MNSGCDDLDSVKPPPLPPKKKHSKYTTCKALYSSAKS